MQLLRDKFPEAPYSAPGRNVGERFEGVLSSCSMLLPLINPVLELTDLHRQGEANVLTDSILVRLALLPYQAYVHVGALMFHRIWRELRALCAMGSGKGKEEALNPLEYGAYYDPKLLIAQLLQDEDRCLEPTQPGWRPWEKNGKLAAWYEKSETALAYNASGVSLGLRDAVMDEHLDPSKREDWPIFKPHMVTMLKLFGGGFEASLRHSCAEFLTEEKGMYTSGKIEDWQRAIAVFCSAHNNLAESPFAVAKTLLIRFPSLAQSRAAGMTCAVMNRTFAEDGAVSKAAPRLEAALATLTKISGHDMVNRKKAQEAALELYKKHELAGKAEKRKEHARLALQRLETANVRDEIKLVSSVRELKDELESKDSSTGSQVAYLKLQVQARVHHASRHTDVSYELADRYLTQNKKIRVSSPDGNGVAADQKYLTELVELMINIDKENDHFGIILRGDAAAAPQSARKVPFIDYAMRCYYARELDAKEKAEMEKRGLQDDPVLLSYEDKYLGALLLDGNVFYKVVDIGWDRSAGVELWSAVCVEVNSKGAIPESSMTTSGRLVRDRAKVRYGLKSDDGKIWAPLEPMIEACKEAQRRRDSE